MTKLLQKTILAAVFSLLGGCGIVSALWQKWPYWHSPGDLGAAVLCSTLPAGRADQCFRDPENVKLLSQTGFFDVSKLPQGSLLGPGSILAASDSAGVAAKGLLTDCLPRDEAPEVHSSATTLSTPIRRIEISAKEFARFEKPAALGPRFADLESIQLLVRDVRREYIERADLLRAIGVVGATPNAVCAYQLANARYVVLETLTVTSRGYRFLDKKNREIKLTAANLDDFVIFGDKDGFSVDERGLLVTKQPKYVAFKMDSIVTYTIRDDEPEAEGLERVLGRFCRLVGPC